MKTQSFVLGLKKEKRCNERKGREKENTKSNYFVLNHMQKKKNQFEIVNYIGQPDISFLILASSTSEYFLCKKKKKNIFFVKISNTGF